MFLKTTACTLTISCGLSVFLGLALAGAQTFQPQTGITCGLVNGVWQPGELRSNSFISYQSQIKKLRANLVRSTEPKRTTIQRKIKTAKAKNREYKALCEAGPNNYSGGVTPTIAPKPTTGSTIPVVNPTKNPSAPNFDANGNVTSTGRELFQIPVAVSANMQRGKVVQENLCGTCHLERTNRTFSYLRFRTAQDPMFFDQVTLSDQDLADLTAYLNRFRQ
jgi:cytochrome c553